MRFFKLENSNLNRNILYSSTTIFPLYLKTLTFYTTFPHTYSSNILFFQFYETLTSIACFFPHVQNSNQLSLATHLIPSLNIHPFFKLKKNLLNIHDSKFNLSFYLILVHQSRWLILQNSYKHCLFLSRYSKFTIYFILFLVLRYPSLF